MQLHEHIRLELFEILTCFPKLVCLFFFHLLMININIIFLSLQLPSWFNLLLPVLLLNHYISANQTPQLRLFSSHFNLCFLSPLSIFFASLFFAPLHRSVVFLPLNTTQVAAAEEKSCHFYCASNKNKHY